MNRNIAFGKQGEDFARLFLLKKGHQILELNFRFEHNEVDLISLDQDILVFSEVKTRSSFDFGFPEEAVTLKKQESLKKVAEFYMTEHPQFEKIRFDIISFLIQKGKIIDVMHFPDAFY